MDIGELVQQLSVELLVWVLIVALLILYVLYYGIKEIVFLALAGYVVRSILPVLPLSASPVGDLSGEAVLFLGSLVIVFLLLSQSAVGRSLRVSRTPYWTSFLFVLATAGFLLSNIWFYNEETIPSEIPLVTGSLFSGQVAQIVWLLAPLVVFFFLKANKRS